MNIKIAELSDLNTVMNISRSTISKIYPHYYPVGAVDFFLSHHCRDNIYNDIEDNRVFLCMNNEQIAVGTVTIKDNEICRLFVLPQYQRQGYGKALLNYAENIIARKFSEVYLAASLPAKKIYLDRGYKEIDYKVIYTENGDFLCYDIMSKG